MLRHFFYFFNSELYRTSCNNPWLLCRIKSMRFYAHNLLKICRAELIRDCSQGIRRGLTLMEMIIALSLMTIVFASVVPLFGQMRDSWESKQAAADTMQNSRILIDHMRRNLSKAIKVTAVSDASQTDGYIEFENNQRLKLKRILYKLAYLYLLRCL